MIFTSADKTVFIYKFCRNLLVFCLDKHSRWINLYHPILPASFWNTFYIRKTWLLPCILLRQQMLVKGIGRLSTFLRRKRRTILHYHFRKPFRCVCFHLSRANSVKVCNTSSGWIETRIMWFTAHDHLPGVFLKLAWAWPFYLRCFLHDFFYHIDSCQVSTHNTVGC